MGIKMMKRKINIFKIDNYDCQLSSQKSFSKSKLVELNRTVTFKVEEAEDQMIENENEFNVERVSVKLPFVNVFKLNKF